MKYFIINKTNRIEKSGKVLQSFYIGRLDFFLVASGKYQQIVFNGLSIFNNIGINIQDDNFVSYFKLKVNDDTEKIELFYSKNFELPILEKVQRAKKHYHKFTLYFGAEIQNLKGLCVATFECNGINFEVFKHKKTEYVCYNGVAIHYFGDIEQFKANLILYNYTAAKIQDFIDKQREKFL